MQATPIEATFFSVAGSDGTRHLHFRLTNMQESATIVEDTLLLGKLSMVALEANRGRKFKAEQAKMSPKHLRLPLQNL